MDTKEKAQTYRVKQGGLMRCCLHSLDDVMFERAGYGADPLSVEGEVLRCRFCEAQMIYHEGAWQWPDPTSAQREATRRDSHRATRGPTQRRRR